MSPPRGDALYLSIIAEMTQLSFPSKKNNDMKKVVIQMVDTSTGEVLGTSNELVVGMSMRPYLVNWVDSFIRGIDKRDCLSLSFVCGKEVIEPVQTSCFDDKKSIINHRGKVCVIGLG